jgi:ABC-type Na+ efflux pump permease subunit
MAVPIILGCIVFFAFLIKLWLAAVAPLSLNSARRNGALELLLCTPVSPHDLVRGQVDALYGYFLAPALIIAGGFTVFGIVGLGLAQNAAIGDDTWPMVYGVFWFVLAFLDFHALAYAGLWFGLTNARVDRAIAKTVFVVLLLPLITLVIPIAGLIGILAWPILWISWASGRLKKRFREEAAEHFSATADESGWFAVAATKARLSCRDTIATKVGHYHSNQRP